MIGTLDVECQAKNPNLPLAPMMAFVNSPSSLRIRNVPKRIGDWCIRNVYVTCVYPDSSIQSVQCVLVGGIWVGTIQGTATSGTSKNGYTIFADGTDENGNNVTGYVLGKGDIKILEADGTLSPDPARYYVKLLSAEAVEPREGDMYPTDDGYVIWQNGQAHLLGTPFEQISAYVESAISAKADLSTLEDYIPYTIDSSGYKSALTIGTRKPDSSVGQFSFSTGANNAAEAMQTVTMGFNNKAQMQDSIAIGQSNNVAGSPAVAIGKSNNVSCINGVCIGANNTISGTNAVAIGTLNNANGDYAIAMGGKARANSNGSFTWSGSDKVNVVVYPQYFDHGKGTFNVNPAGGLSGFYIGEQSLNGILSSKADLSAIPSNTSQLSNDSGYITSSDIHSDYIEDTDGNKINADRNIVEVDLTTPWTVHDQQPYTMDYNQQLSVWEYINEASNKTTLYYNSTDGQWIMEYFIWIDGGWMPAASNYATGTMYDQSIYFPETTLTVTRTTHFTGKLATQNWVLEQLSALEARIAALEGN